MSELIESRRSFGELFDWDQNRVRRVAARRLRRDGSAESIEVLRDPEMFDEFCARLFDDAPVFGKLSDFIDWLLALDWSRIVEIIKIIIALFA